MIFFIGVILGMQKAQTGLVNMRGYDDPEFKNAAALNMEDGKIEAELMGNETASHDLLEKKKKLEEMKAFNAFSSLGKKVSDSVEKGVTKIVDILVEE